jgi:hypothetical protein
MFTVDRDWTKPIRSNPQASPVHGLVEQYPNDSSLSLKGEPVVNAPANAFHTFRTSEMDTLVLQNFLVEKSSL